MASKADLLDALSARGNMLQGWLQEISGDIQTKQGTLDDLRKQRKDKLAEIAAGMLPDLSDSSLAALQQVVPNFLAPATVAQMKAAETQAVKNQLQQLSTGFDQENYEGQLSEQIDTAQRQLSALDEEFANLMATPGLNDLIQRHYGEHSYVSDPHHQILGRLYDWVHADDVAREIGVDGWPEVREKYRDFGGRRAALTHTIERATGQLDELKRNKQLRDDLEGMTDDKLERRVLEKARTGLAARMDSSGQPADMLREVNYIDTEIGSLQSEIGALQAKRSTISEQLDQTLQLHTTAANNQYQQVPDQYVTQVRNSLYQPNPPMPGGHGNYGGYGQTYIQPVYMQDNTSWILPALFFAGMADHWGGYGGYRGGGETIINNYGEPRGRDVYASRSNFSSSS